MYAPDICLFHADCVDGFGAAWAIWRRWPTCAFIPAEYGAPLDLDDIEGKNILFVDFSAPAETLRTMVAEGKAASIIVLDHHKSARASLINQGFEEFIVPLSPDKLADPLPAGAIVVLFDMERSGARMAWKFAGNDGQLGTGMIHLIEDRDLWRFESPDTKPFIAALNSFPQDFQVWDTLADWALDTLINEGQSILRAQVATVEMLLKQAYTGDIAGHTVPMVNAPKQFASDACHRLLELNPTSPFAASWFRRADGLLEFSLRSEDHRMDVSEVAAAFGGGGHRNAAGFQLAIVEHGHSIGAV